ncbi:maternal effect protein oskar-like [Leptopilina heterotoma]|uniref:maternal effect protein oskar-like n=1 Tax=Leptopilina heterotoma TaxID=63436 RepID=UPI001CA84A99|nr:maternal effect protein oskar-like [Leptopilina heterotoma]
MDYVEVTNVVKALIVARKGGMPVEELDSEFEEIEGRYIPYLKLGYNTLFDYLQDVKEIRYRKNYNGDIFLTVNDPKVNHLNELIKNQKPARTNKKRSRRQRKVHNKRHLDYDVNNNSFDCQQHQQYSPSISSGYKSASTSMSDDYDRPMINIDTRRRNNYVYEPIFNRKQLIGDDFLLQLAIKELKVPIWRKAEKSALYTGLCVSGQTIRQCIRKLDTMNAISDRITIMLGAVDIYQGRTLEQMRADYRELLNLIEIKFNIPRTSITLCTIPPLANLSFRIDFEKCSTLHLFNNWLRNIWREYCEFDMNGYYLNYSLADFDETFRNDAGGINYNYYQNDARYVSGTRQPWVLFNGRGRKLALHLIQYS